MPGDHKPVLIDDPRPAAGELGQATQSPPLEPDATRSVTSNRRGWLVPVGAAAAAILAAGALGLATHRTPSEPAPAPVPGIGAARPGVVAAGPAGLIVRDGDLVEASGPVEDSRMCSLAPVPAINAPCPWGIRVPGVKPTDGATLRGRWHPNGLSDIRRMPYSPTSAGVLGDSDLPDTPPCPTPAGGWRDGEDWSDDHVRDTALGIYLPISEDGKMRVYMVQLTQPLYDTFAAIGLDHLILDPWIRPAGP